MDTVIETATTLFNTMVKQKHLVAYYIGIFFIIVSHLFMINKPGMYWHSIFNLIAAGLIAYYFMDKEFGYMKSEGSPVVPPVVPVPAPVVPPAAV
jgi:hypothetical protein